MKDAPVNACPDCGSTQRTMIQDASNDEIVWSCDRGHTWRDGQTAGPAKPARSSGPSSPEKKDRAEKDAKQESPRST